MCYQRAIEDPRSACLQSMRNNGVCDPQCNNADCGHDGYVSDPTDSAGEAMPDCSARQVADRCSQLMQADQTRDFTRPVAARFPVGISFDVRNLRLKPAQDGTMVASSTISVTLQWKDERLFSTECLAVLPYVMSLLEHQATEERRTQVSNYARSLLFLPRIMIDHALSEWPYYLTSSEYRIGATSPWLNNGPGAPPIRLTNQSTAPACSKCVTYSERMELAIGLDWSYFYFPFDRQEISFSLTVTDASLVGCEAIASNLLEGELLTESTWWLRTLPGRSHSVHSELSPGGDTCYVTVGV